MLNSPAPSLIDYTYIEILTNVTLGIDSLLLVGSERGLYVINYLSKQPDILVRYYEQKNEHSISSGYIYSLFKDSKGNIWIGTDKGLNMIKAGNKLNRDTPFEKFRNIPLLANSVISFIMEGNKDEYWIGTVKGLCRLNMNNQTCKLYNNIDGLPSINFNPNAVYKNSFGRIYIGTNKGMFYFHPDSVFTDEKLLTPIFTSFKLFRQEYALDTNITFKKNITLPYNQNHLAIKFAALHFVNPAKIQYQYRLDGYEDYWTNSGNDREAVYTSLPPGNYKLLVKAANNDGKWGEPTVLHIRITPPFWQTWWFLTIATLIIICIFFIYIKNRERILKENNRLLESKVKQRTAEVIQQKEIVEEKNKKITESISYALRIQTAILPSDKLVREYLKNSFILYLPKDIVAGDFYWMETLEAADGNSNKPLENLMLAATVQSQIILFAVCDCTGHGVPGAMVSVMCYNALNRSIREYGLTEPAKVLDKVVELVQDNFAKSEDDIQDGMDASLCAYYPKQKKLQWAGANNPLWIIRNNEIIEYKPDKQPIGKYEHRMPYTNHEIELLQGDTIYIFSDGYHSQFGGNQEKKLAKKGLKNILLSISHLNMDQQREELIKFHHQWKGEEEQVDDICVIGLRV